MALLNTSIFANLTSLAEGGNQTNTSNCSPDGWIYAFVPPYIMTISVLGIILNIFVLMVFILHKKPCSVPEIYLSNLAAADLLLVSFLPFWAANVWNKFEWKYGLHLCKMVSVSLLMNAYCSIYFLVLVSLDRYLAVVYPLSNERMRRSKCAKICCLLVWILGFLLSIPKLINRNFITHGNVTKCGEPDKTLYLTTELMIFVLGFFIPIFVILFCTVKILRVLGNRLEAEVNAKKNDQKATTLVLAVLLMFLICWVPFHLLKIPVLLFKTGILTSCMSQKIILACMQIFSYLAFFNSVLNPILYVIVGKNFQKKVMELYGQWDPKWRYTNSVRSTSTKVSRSVKSQFPLT